MNKQILSIVALSTLCIDNLYATDRDKNLGQPNVIFIYADDMGKGMLSAYGQKIIETPNIDRVVSQGVQFNHAYGSHYSAPARAALLTGYSDCHKGHWVEEKSGVFATTDTTIIAKIEVELDNRNVGLSKGDDYLAEVFRKAGYTTGQIGKLEYGFVTSRNQMKSHGWDYFYGYLDHTRCHGFYPPFLFENDQIVMIDGNTHANCAASYGYRREEVYRERLNKEGKAQYSQDLFNDKIAEFIDTHRDEPFFLYHPTQLPHGPVTVPEIHEQVKYKTNLTPIEKEYATMVILLDEAVGKILTQVEELGIADNTMIIFSVDNGHEIYTSSDMRTESDRNYKTGEMINDYDVRFTSEFVGDIFNGNMGMTGRKRSNFDGGVKVPLSFYFPGKLEPRECDEVVANYDLIATMGEMLGVKVSKKKDARSYFPLLTDSEARLPQEKFVLCDSHNGPTIITNEGWKLRYCDVTDEYELYNIRNDFREENNLSKQQPERVAQLRAILAKKVETTMSRGEYVR